jgi:hypothetical protein
LLALLQYTHQEKYYGRQDPMLLSLLSPFPSMTCVIKSMSKWPTVFNTIFNSTYINLRIFHVAEVLQSTYKSDHVAEVLRANSIIYDYTTYYTIRTSSTEEDKNHTLILSGILGVRSESSRLLQGQGWWEVDAARSGRRRWRDLGRRRRRWLEFRRDVQHWLEFVRGAVRRRSSFSTGGRRDRRRRLFCGWETLTNESGDSGGLTLEKITFHIRRNRGRGRAFSM